MTMRLRATLVTMLITALVGLGHVPASAADGAPVVAAAHQVGQGATQIGQGQVIDGMGETAKGIGNTVVESVKYACGVLGDAGQSVRDFFVNLFE